MNSTRVEGIMVKEQKIPNFRIFSILALSFLIGIVGSSFLNLKWQFSWSILSLTAVLLLLYALFSSGYKNKYLVLLSWAFIAVATGMSWYIHYDQKSEVKISYGEEVEFSGKIIRQPEKDYKQQKIIVKTNKFNQPTNILINAPRYPDFSYGDEINVIGKIEKPGMIEDFDYGNYLKKYAVYSVIYQPQEFVKVGEDKSAIGRGLRVLYNIPKIFEGSINRVLVEPQASLAGGLLFGSKRNIPDNLKDDLANAGLTHIIALSGYNVTIIIAVLAMILAKYFGNKKAFWIGSVLVVLFVIITGAAPSVLRAAVFSLLIIYGRLLGRKGNQTNLMLLAAVLILILNPYLLVYDIGFQLSFGAFAGLIYLSPVNEKIFERSSLEYMPIYFKAPLIETLSAQIMVLPLLVLYFGKLSFIAPIANVLVLWIIPIAMLMSFSTSVATLIWWPLGKLISILTWPILTYITAMSSFMSKLPFSNIEVKNFNYIMAFALYFVLVIVILVINKRLKKFKQLMLTKTS